MEAFPSALEQTAASALLLLSSSVPSAKSPPRFCTDESGEGVCKINCANRSLLLTESKSCSSSITSDGSSVKIQGHRLRVIAVLSHFHEMKLKVVKKSRSKNYRRSDSQKMDWGLWKKTATSKLNSTSEGAEPSCWSSGSSARSCCSVQRVRKEEKLSVVKQDASAHMQRRAEDILRVLSGGCTSEVRIRQILGDTPDTSKALRMLLKLEIVKRSGQGGRIDPYMYTIKQKSPENI